MSVVNVLKRGVQSEVQNIKRFVTTPTGPFETLDAMIRDARAAMREAARAIGIRKPSFLGQVGLRRFPRRRVLRR